jgi:cell fate regulator YaaT (PSP1 superfamily)
VVANSHYLVQYGRPGFVGRFAAESPLARGDRVVVRGPRGVEFGEVLVAQERSTAADDGEVVRVATHADDVEAGRLDTRGQQLLATALASDSGLPLAFVDVEVTLDCTAILHALAWEACDATPLLDELAARFGLAVRLLDLSRAPASKEAKEDAGCGKPGCGSGGGGCSSCGTGGSGGCSTGSCSRGAVKSPEELTAYFADLRQKMQDAGLVRTPLN